MDFVKSFTGGEGDNLKQRTEDSSEQKSGGGGFLGGIGDKLNAAAGGGPESEKNETVVGKGIDLAQEHIFGQGQQSNESAYEQAKDRQFEKFITGK